LRIKEDTPARLVLRDRIALWVSLVCFAAAILLTYQGLTHAGDAMSYIPATLFAAFGLAFLRLTDVEFDKIRRICKLRRFDVIRLTRASFHFEEILDLRVETSPGGDPDSLTCRLSLVTTSGIVPLTISYEPDLPRYDAMRDQVALALAGQLPLPAARDPVRALVDQGRVIDAVAMLRKLEGLDLTAARERIEKLRKGAREP
jgi:hypothetical protein